MIYYLDESYIDLGKLEFIDRIRKNNKDKWYLGYQINGIKYTTNLNTKFCFVDELRDKLIKDWRNYKDQL